MKPATGGPSAAARSLVAAALRAYPRRFLLRMGDDMVDAFDDGWRDARRRSAAAALLFTLRTAASLTLSGVGERLSPSPGPPANPPPDNGMLMMDALRQDVRYAVRALLRRPGFTAVAVVTLALGVGANTAIFSVVDGVLLTPLPYPEPDRLVTVWTADETDPDDKEVSSKADLEDVAATSAFEGLVGWSGGDVALTGMGDAELVKGTRVTGGLLEVFGLPPFLGRDIRPEEAVEGGPDVVMVSHAFWTERLGADPEALGRTLELQGESYEVVGVAPPGFDFPDGSSLWRPFDQDWSDDHCGRGCHTLRAIGRLRPGVTLEAARAQAGALALRLQNEFKGSNHATVFNLVPLEEDVVGDVRTGLWVLLAAVGIVLLIACANVANLLLVRAQTRAGEVAVRAALGASGGRLAAQVLVESLVLAFAGGVAGVVLAVFAVDGLKALAPPDIPRLDQVAVSGTVLLFALALVGAVALLFGLAPALRLAHASPAEEMGAAGGRRSGDRREVRSRNALLAGEVALSVMLLVGAGLLLKSFARLVAVDPGYEIRSIVRFDLALPQARYAELDAIVAFVDGVEARIRGIPGVDEVGTVFGAPLGRSNIVGGVLVEGRPEPEPADETYAALRPATHGYLGTLRIPVLRGRGLEPADGQGGAPVAVVNERFVRENFPGDEVLGARVRATVGFGHGSPYFTVVGVVPDVLSSALDGEPRAEMYVPLAHMGPGSFTVSVRGVPGAPPLLPAVREQVRAMDAGLPLRRVESMEEAVRRQLAAGRFYLTLVGLFAGLAVVLAAVGLYGVVAYLVSRRTREIGVRMAMGAGRGTIVRLVLGQGLRPAGLGLALGLGGAWLGSRVLESLLYRVEPTDPWIFLAVAVLLASVVAAATLLPARSATRVDPVHALRAE